MAKKSKPTSSHALVPLPIEITDLANLIQSGQFSAWKMEQGHNGSAKFHGTAPDGAEIIIQKKIVEGYSRTTTETMNKPTSIAERRVRVRELRSEGMTQAQIAERTGYSQKTISNDCNALDLD